MRTFHSLTLDFFLTTLFFLSVFVKTASPLFLLFFLFCVPFVRSLLLHPCLWPSLYAYLQLFWCAAYRVCRHRAEAPDSLRAEASHLQDDDLCARHSHCQVAILVRLCSIFFLIVVSATCVPDTVCHRPQSQALYLCAVHCLFCAHGTTLRYRLCVKLHPLIFLTAVFPEPFFFFPISLVPPELSHHCLYLQTFASLA